MSAKNDIFSKTTLQKLKGNKDLPGQIKPKGVHNHLNMWNKFSGKGNSYNRCTKEDEKGIKTCHYLYCKLCRNLNDIFEDIEKN